jgi:hypothetical protein
MVGEKRAEERVKADMKRPTEATVPPSEVMYMG